MSNTTTNRMKRLIADISEHGATPSRVKKITNALRAVTAERDAAADQVKELESRLAEPKPRPIDTAPKDGRLLRLFVHYETDDWTPLEDADKAWTIGFNALDATGEDEWKMAGWCWEHDHFTEGKGEPIGWLPFHCAEAVTVQPLAWCSAGYNGQSQEASALGLDVFYRVSGKPGDWTLTSPGAREYVHTPGYAARADARAAAQVDYARRVFGALTDVPAREVTVREALLKWCDDRQAEVMGCLELNGKEEDAAILWLNNFRAALRALLQGGEDNG